MITRAPRRLLSRWRPLAAFVLLLALPWGGAPTARANGLPTVVPLAYIEGLSNWGPLDASGELELSFSEGYATLTATGMPELTGGGYQGWLVNSESNDAISIGRFNADETEQVSFESTLPIISNFGFDLFIITVEPDPDDAPQPTSDRSIGGYFSLIEPDPGDSSSLADAGATQAPAELPNTGDATLATDAMRVGVLVAAMATALAVGLRLGRRRA